MCCTDAQWSFLVAYPSACFAITLLWSSIIIRPLRIFSVVLHEFSHGVAILISCGTIHDVTVNRYEGGLIRWSPRCTSFMRCAFPLIAASGYIGVSLFGTVLVVSVGLPGWRVTMLRSFAGLLILASLIALRRAALRFEATWMFLFGILSVICSMRPASVFTWYYTLFGSSMLNIYAAYDVYDDTVRRSVDDSDASYFSLALFGSVSKSRLIGRIWYLICVSLHLLGACLTMAYLGDGNEIEFSGVASTRYILFLWAVVFALLSTACTATFTRV